jgi:hypothetical protein
LRIIDGAAPIYTTPEGMATAGRRFDVCPGMFPYPYISRHHRTSAFLDDVRRIFPRITEIGDSLVY